MSLKSDQIKLAIAGICAVALALGIGRFSYTPILPFMRESLDLSFSQAGIIGSWNYFGYLLGSFAILFPFFSYNLKSSFITACTNDFNFSSIFSRQISAFDPCLGLIIGLSTSGKSSNVLNALSTASDLSIPTVLLTGLSGASHSYIDHFISFPSSNTALVQTYTQVFYHSVCSLVDQHFLDHA